MRRRKAVIALGLAAATVMTAMTGCTSGVSDGSVHLKMVESLTNPSRTAVLKKLIADFEKKNPKIKVDLISPPTDQADQKIQQMLQSGSGVDALEVRDITAGPWGPTAGSTT
ncbi:ABC transporter substrate-binding protein [Streptomyces sp. FXJ1.4098]|nr:ABC transporter substrate-binding protein [Streptomyces sp. FXJ1.4098]